MKRHHNPIAGERACVERHVRNLAGISTAMLFMQGSGGCVSNFVLHALAETLAFHAEQLAEALGIELEEDEPCA